MITNKYNLPEPLVAVLSRKTYAPKPKRISVTQLLDAPLRRILLMRHADEIVSDVSENLWAMLGTMAHKIIEESSDHAEEKFAVDTYGATLVGKIDYNRDGQVIDWKVTTKWSAIFADTANWDEQLQVYGYLLRKSGKPVKTLSVYMILRDWNKRDAQRNPDHPQIPFVEISYDVWPDEKIEAYIKDRVELHLAAEQELKPEHWCSDKDRWHKDDKWAVIKKGAKRAYRVVDTLEEAEKIKTPEHIIEFRKGEDTKCADYCDANTWCPYWQESRPKEGDE